MRTAETDAVLPEKFWLVAMMSKAWAEKHKVTQPQDYNARQETFAVRNANGTGPFMLERYEADARTVLKANPRWWGRGTPFGGGNLDEAVFVVIQSDATRLAALASKQVDLVLDPPLQDLPRLKADASIKLVRRPTSARSTSRSTSTAPSCRTPASADATPSRTAACAWLSGRPSTPT